MRTVFVVILFRRRAMAISDLYCQRKEAGEFS